MDAKEILDIACCSKGLNTLYTRKYSWKRQKCFARNVRSIVAVTAPKKKAATVGMD